jgi:hypothetical protein
MCSVRLHEQPLLELIMTIDYSLMVVVLALSIAVALIGLVWLFIRPESYKTLIAKSRRPLGVLLVTVVLIMIGAVYVMEHSESARDLQSARVYQREANVAQQAREQVLDTHLAITLLQRDTDKLLADVLGKNIDAIPGDVAQVEETLRRARSTPNPDLYSSRLMPLLDQMQGVIESLQKGVREPNADLEPYATSLLTLKSKLQGLDYESDLQTTQERRQPKPRLEAAPPERQF